MRCVERMSDSCTRGDKIAGLNYVVETPDRLADGRYSWEWSSEAGVLADNWKDGSVGAEIGTRFGDGLYKTSLRIKRGRVVGWDIRSWGNHYGFSDDASGASNRKIFEGLFRNSMTIGADVYASNKRGQWEISPVPLPAAAWLLLAGVSSLSFACRRSSRKPVRE